MSFHLLKEKSKNTNYLATINKKNIHNLNHLPFLPIAGFDKINFDQMLNEAINLKNLFVEHRPKDGCGWKSLCIHGLSSVHTDHHNYYGYENRDKAPYKWTDLSNFCPTIVNFFKKDFDYKIYDRIRIMKLEPGGYIMPHQDVFDKSEQHLGPINISLNNPDKCKFYMENIGYLPFNNKKIIMLNLYNIHWVYNESDEARYHLIVHGKKGESWSKRITKSFEQLDA